MKGETDHALLVQRGAPLRILNAAILIAMKDTEVRLII